MQIKLFGMYFTESTKWDSKTNLELYIEIKLHVGISYLPFFSVGVANKVFCRMNPFSALIAALESETVASAKYDALKARARDKGLWQKL